MSKLSSLIKIWNNFSFLDVSINKIHVGVGIGTGLVFGGYVSLHTLFLDKYRNVFQLYKNGFVSPMAPELKARIDQVVNDMKLSDKYRAYLDSFYVPGFDPMHMGSFKLRSGAYIGIPRNFLYNSKRDIERDLILMERQPVPWGSDAGELFQDSLVLSENAQKFAIARELSHLNTNYVYHFGLISCFALQFQYAMSAYLSHKTYGRFKPKSYRYTLYSLVGVFTYGVWSAATDTLTKYYEERADAKASQLGINYAKGGAEFYTKLARRNIAAREMMGVKGEKLFTKYGNSNTELIRQRHIPVSIRKERAESRVQAYLDVKSPREVANAYS